MPKHLLLLLTLTCCLAACDDDDGHAAPTATPTHSNTATPSVTVTRTSTPVATATLSPSRTATATATLTATTAPTLTATPSPSTTATSPPTFTATAAGTPAVDRAQAVTDIAATGVGKYLGRAVPAPSGFEGKWQRYDFATSDEGPICLYGTPYRVYFRPGTSNNVLFYLEGGGACWNNDTCWHDTRAKITADPLAPLDIFPGILLQNDPTNPFTTWNVVYVPYCDGSVFAGDNIADYENGRVWHRGISNLSTGVDVMKSLVAAPDKIVVSGSSAGGFGTFSGYGVMRLAYPDTEILVLNDSGPGIQNQADMEALIDRETNWRLAQFLPRSCQLCLGQPLFLVDWSMNRDPTLRTGLFSTEHDFVIRDFLKLSPEAFEELLLDITGRVQARQPNRFKRYFVDDEFHTILLGGGVTPEGNLGRSYRNLRVGDNRMPEWVFDFVNNGPRWQDVIEPHKAP